MTWVVRWVVVDWNDPKAPREVAHCARWNEANDVRDGNPEQSIEDATNWNRMVAHEGS